MGKCGWLTIKRRSCRNRGIGGWMEHRTTDNINTDKTDEEVFNMKVLIVGSGGREHAIAASVAKSPKADKIYCAPGNAGIAEYAQCVDIGAMEFDKLAAFAKENDIDLCIVGMDDPLVGGLVDVMEE